MELEIKKVISKRENIDSDSPKERVKELISDCTHKSNKTQNMAQLLKVLNIIIAILIVCGGILVSVSGIYQEQTNYIQAISGALIAGMKSFSSAFSIEKRGYVYKILSVKFRKLSRKLVNLKHMKASDMDYNNAVANAYKEFDDLDVTMYSNDYVDINSLNSDKV